MIRCRQLQWGPPGQPLDLTLATGSLTGLIGGSGKSSLLRVPAGPQPPLAPFPHPEERSVPVLIALLASHLAGCSGEAQIFQRFQHFCRHYPTNSRR